MCLKQEYNVYKTVAHTYFTTIVYAYKSHNNAKNLSFHKHNTRQLKGYFKQLLKPLITNAKNFS